MSPQRGIAATKNGPTANRNPVSKVDLVSGGDNASGAQKEARISRIHHLGVRYRIDLIHPNYFRISFQYNFIATANNIQMADSDVVPQCQLLHSNNQIEVSNLNVIVDLAVNRVNDTEPNLHPLSDLVAKKQPITGALCERR
jgi:hypothetical protein